MSHEIAKAEWERATEGLGAARTLVVNGYNKDAVSRCYYAMLHAAKAGLIAKGIDAETHRGVSAMFGKHLVTTGEVDGEQGRNLRRAAAAREDADYRAHANVTREQAQREVERAERFLNAIQKHLERSSVLRRQPQMDDEDADE